MEQNQDSQSTYLSLNQRSSEIGHILFETARNGLFIVNGAGELVDANAVGCDLTGYHRDALLNLSLPDLLIDEMLLRQLPPANLHPQLTRQPSCLLRGQDGRSRFVDLEIHPLADGHFLLLARPGAQNQSIEGELYQALLADAVTGFWVTDEDGRFLDVNDAYLRRSGYSRAEMLALHVADVEAQETPEEIAAHIQQVMQLGRSLFETRHRTKDGVVWPVEITTTYANGRFFTFLYDITNRKRMENELRQKHKALEYSLNGFDIVSAEGKFVYANRAYLSMWGYDSLDEILGTSPAGHCADPTIPETIIRNLEEKGEHTLQFTARRKDGSTFEVMMTAHKVVDDQGVVTYAGTSIDITDLQQARQALLTEQAHLRNVLDTIPDLVWLKDPDGFFLAGNPTFERFLGVKEADFIGKTDYDFFKPELAEFFRQHDRKAIVAGKPTVNEEWVTSAVDGRLVLLETIKTPTYDNKGQLLGVLGIARDITEHKLAAEALQQQITLQTQLSQVAETVPGMICSFQLLPDGSTKMPYSSGALDDIYGLDAAELAADAAPLFAIMHPDDVQRVHETIIESARTMTQWHAEYRVHHPQKGEIWIEGRSMPQRQADGSILWHGFVQDVTNRKQVEASLYLMSEIQKQISSLNNLDKVYQLVGSTVQKLIGHGYTIASVFDEKTQSMRVAGLYGFGNTYQKLIQRFKIDPAKMTYSLADMTAEELRVFRSGRLDKFEGGLYALLTRKVPRQICEAVEKQLKITAIYTISFVWNEAHYGGLIILSGQDISPYKEMVETIMNQAAIAIKRIKTEEGLRESEVKLRLFIEHAPASLAMFDHHMRYLAVSRRWMADYNLGDRDIIGQSHYEIFPEILDRWKNVHRRGLAGEVIQADEDEFVRLDGSVQWLRWEVRPWYTADETIGGIVIFSEDITKRRQAEEALRESQEILAQAESVAKIGSWKWDLTTQKVTWSDEMFNLFGVDRENFDGDVNRVVNSRIHPDDIAAVNQSNLAVLEDYDPVPLEYRIVLPDGTQRIVWAEGRLVHDADGRPTALVGYVQDITESKQAEKALQEMAENMAAAQQMTHSGSWEIRLTPELTFVEPQMWSDECYRICGYEPGAVPITADFFYNLVHPDDRESAQQALMEAIRNRDEAAYEYRLIRADGSVRMVRDRAKVVLDERTNLPVKVVGIVKDITESKQAEATIDLLNRRMELILNSAGEGIYGSDVDGRITFVNPAMAHMVGWQPDELLGQDAHAIFHHTRADGRAYLRTECDIHLAMQAGISHHDEDDLYWRRDGTALTVEYTSTPIRENGQVVGTVVVVKDITERKRAAEEQALLAEQLRQAQKMESIGRLAGGVAHDFNNQLTIIQIYSDLMCDLMEEDDPLLPKLNQIRQAGEHAAGLTRQLLAFSRKQILQPATINLNNLITNLQNMLARLIGEDIILSTVLQPELWSIKADPGQIEQVIMNLIVNARDAMPKGGMLTIETNNVVFDEYVTSTHLDAPIGPCVILAITDTGHGMDAATQSQIFEPFFTTKMPGKGTGLGLATVHGIVKQSGGSIFVYSEPGKGTTFKICLPADEMAAEQVVVYSSSTVMHQGHETVLLVEDETALRELMRVTLEEIGYTVLEAYDAHQALLLADQYQASINLLLTDVVMPQMSGRELAETLMAHHPGTKVLYVSGYMDDAVVRHGLLTAEVNFLPKPFTRSALAAKVREVLDKN